jgi:uncharacterized membrane protein YgcG
MAGHHVKPLRQVGLLLVCLLAGLVVSAGHAAERILEFHSDITVAKDASMTVTETIRVRAEGQNIRRGIYRDFPTDYRDRLGNRYRVAFEVLQVTRNGNSEPWRVERLGNGVRVYVGSASVFLDPGIYTYTIRYRTDRQLGFFADHDGLYWNVTGNGWSFRIDEASATVRLPDTVPADTISIEGYTGPQGSTQRSFASNVRGGEAFIRATRPLGREEGLTLVAMWPKGHVTEPGAVERLGYLLSDNWGLALALGALALSFIYLYWVWSKFGRDPEPGVIFPHYEPPKGYSPASARFIEKMAYDPKVLSAAVINLGVKGYLTIDKTGKHYVLTKGESQEPLAPGEAALYKKLFRAGPVVTLDDESYEEVGAARTAHMAALKRNYEKIYFFTNVPLLIPSLLLSALAAAIIFGRDEITIAVIVVLAANALLHGLFYLLMRAPTPKGRNLLDKLEGFKLFLNVAEKDDLNVRNPPEKTPELFERYLPFALALGVEQAWAEQFTDLFRRLQAEQGVDYRPRWYRGDFNANRLGSFADNVGSSFSSAISSAATPPGSSSGGSGGGSSGGGGGGGGGGGW